MKIRIGVLTHYSAMESEFRHLEKELDCTLIFRLGVMEDAVDVAIELEQKEKVDAIVTRAFTAEFLRECVRVPLVTIQKEPYEILSTLYNARQNGARRIAYVDSVNGEMPIDYDKMKQIVNCDLRPYQLKTGKEAPELIKMAIQDGCDEVVSSAGCMRAQAKKHGLPHGFIKVSEVEMTNAVNAAKYISRLIRNEAQKAAYLRAMVDASITATFTVGAEGRIEFANAEAEQVFRLSENKLVGHTMAELSAEEPLFASLTNMDGEMDMISRQGKHLLVNRQEVKAKDGGRIGTVYHLQKATEVERRELALRQKVHEQGFLAQKTFADIVGHSAAILDVIETAKRYAAAPSNVLITGESGSGKEIFAQSIHNSSGYRTGPFLAINCATLPENLLEAELFGYTEGSFTGARKGGKAGVLELAHGGTLFLDEIGDMPLPLQAKLLRVLQERQIRRIGGEKNLPIDVRIISATNIDLTEAVAKGNFRMDLFYRINVLSLRIPPLRARKEDIRDLAEMFLKTLTQRMGRPCRFSANCFEAMERYDWPGNIRELQNFVERVAVMNDRILVPVELVRSAMEKMGMSVLDPTISEQAENDALVIPIASLKEMEQEILRQMYARLGGDKKEIERVLDMSSTTLWRRLKQASMEHNNL